MITSVYRILNVCNNENKNKGKVSQNTTSFIGLLNYYTNHCTYIKFIKFYTLKH